MRVNLVDPGSATQVVSRQTSGEAPLDVIGIGCRVHEPIALCYLAPPLLAKGHEVKIISPVSSSLSIEEIMEGNPQVVAFSALSFNYLLVWQAAKLIKEINPSIKTVLGGYHALNLAKEISQEGAFDFVIFGEGDFTLADLVETIQGQLKMQQVRGVVYQAGQAIAYNPARVKPDDNPIPFRTSKMMKDRKRYGLFYPAPSQQQAMILVVASRGCPYHCHFCLSPKMFPGGTMYRNPSNIRQEIAGCISDFGTNAAFFIDDEFGGGNSNQVKAICEAIQGLGLQGWYAMSRVDAAPETFEYMAQAGCTKVGLGVESLVHSWKNGAQMSSELVQERLDLLRSLGIFTKVYIIAGGWGDSSSDVEAEEEEIMSLRADELRISFMLYSPGTEEFEQAKKADGFVTDDLTKFSTDYPVIKVEGMTPDQLLEKRRSILRRFYGSRAYARRAKTMVAQRPHLDKSYAEFDQILHNSLGIRIGS